MAKDGSRSGEESEDKGLSADSGLGVINKSIWKCLGLWELGAIPSNSGHVAYISIHTRPPSPRRLSDWACLLWPSWAGTSQAPSLPPAPAPNLFSFQPNSSKIMSEKVLQRVLLDIQVLAE